jgi:hypothetical protein
MEAELPDVSCAPALLVKIDHRQQFRNFFPEMEMPSHDTVFDVMEFLGSYRKAFENYDTDAILDHYVFPCTIISDTERLRRRFCRQRKS